MSDRTLMWFWEIHNPLDKQLVICAKGLKNHSGLRAVITFLVAYSKEVRPMYYVGECPFLRCCCCFL